MTFQDSLSQQLYYNWQAQRVRLIIGHTTSIQSLCIVADFAPTGLNGYLPRRKHFMFLTHVTLSLPDLFRTAHRLLKAHSLKITYLNLNYVRMTPESHPIQRLHFPALTQYVCREPSTAIIATAPRLKMIHAPNIGGGDEYWPKSQGGHIDTIILVDALTQGITSSGFTSLTKLQLGFSKLEGPWPFMDDDLHLLAKIGNTCSQLVVLDIASIGGFPNIRFINNWTLLGHEESNIETVLARAKFPSLQVFLFHFDHDISNRTGVSAEDEYLAIEHGWVTALNKDCPKLRICSWGTSILNSFVNFILTIMNKRQ